MRQAEQSAGTDYKNFADCLSFVDPVVDNPIAAKHVEGTAAGFALSISS